MAAYFIISSSGDWLQLQLATGEARRGGRGGMAVHVPPRSWRRGREVALVAGAPPSLPLGVRHPLPSKAPSNQSAARSPPPELHPQPLPPHCSF